MDRASRRYCRKQRRLRVQGGKTEQQRALADVGRVTEGQDGELALGNTSGIAHASRLGVPGQFESGHGNGGKDWSNMSWVLGRDVFIHDPACGQFCTRASEAPSALGIWTMDTSITTSYIHTNNLPVAPCHRNVVCRLSPESSRSVAPAATPPSPPGIWGPASACLPSLAWRAGHLPTKCSRSLPRNHGAHICARISSTGWGREVWRGRRGEALGG